MRRLALAAALLALPAFAQAPFRTLEDTRDLAVSEQRLWEQAAEFDRLIEKTALLDTDAGLRAYLQQVLDDLFPQLKGQVRVRVLRSPMLNAFSIPNGSIYVNLGLLTRFDNEAQLAAVLAHEGSHFTHRHGTRIQERAKTASLIQLVSALLGVPYGNLRDLVMASSMFGYSRDMEREADAAGFDRMKEAGYDLQEAPRVFTHLLRELEASGIKEPFFFATHPKLQERIDSYGELIRQEPPGGKRGEDAFARMVAKVRLANLDLDLSLHRPRSVLVALDYGAAMARFPAEAWHRLGEAYRQRGEPWDEELAEDAWQRALREAPGFPEPRFALGQLYLKKGRWQEAREALAGYLAAAPEGPHKRFAGQYLQLAEERLAAP